MSAAEALAMAAIVVEADGGEEQAQHDQHDQERDRLRATIEGWLHAKVGLSGSARTREAYAWTLARFRAFLQARGHDLDSPAAVVADAAQLWTRLREPRMPRAPRTPRDGTIQPIAHAVVVWDEATGTALHDATRAPAGPPVALSTVKQRLAILSSFYTFARKRERAGFDGPNPIERLEAPHVEEYDHAVPLDAVTVAARLAAIPRDTLIGARDYALLAVALSTGRRRAELAGLTWGAVTLTGDVRGWLDALDALDALERGERGEGTVEPPVVTLTFPVKGAKLLRDRLEAPATRALLAYETAVYGPDLGTLPPETPLWLAHSPRMGGNWQRLSMRALSDIWRHRLGTGKVHTSRHTFAHQMEQSGAPVSVIQQRLGHSSLATTSRYLAHLSSDANPYAGVVAARLGIQ